MCLHLELYFGLCSCRPYGAPFYGGLVAPFGIVYIYNWITFIIILVSLLRKKTVNEIAGGDKIQELKAKLRQQFIAALTLSLLFGSGWGLGFAATSSIRVGEVSVTLQALFITLTSFQGLFIFITQCVRSEDARNEWARWAHFLTYKKFVVDANKKQRKARITSRESNYTSKPRNMYGNPSIHTDSNSDTLKQAVKMNVEGYHLTKMTPSALQANKEITKDFFEEYELSVCFQNSTLDKGTVMSDLSFLPTTDHQNILADEALLY